MYSVVSKKCFSLKVAGCKLRFRSTIPVPPYLDYEKSREKTIKSREKPLKSREKIVVLLSEDGKLSATALAEKIGISAKSVEKHLANLKADGIIERIGPAKGGYWKVK